MRKYTILTFRCKHDAILMRECFAKIGIRCCLINAPEGIDSPCSFVLNVYDLPIDKLNCALCKCKKITLGAFRIIETDECVKYWRIM